MSLSAQSQLTNGGLSLWHCFQRKNWLHWHSHICQVSTHQFCAVGGNSLSSCVTDLLGCWHSSQCNAVCLLALCLKWTHCNFHYRCSWTISKCPQAHRQVSTDEAMRALSRSAVLLQQHFWFPNNSQMVQLKLFVSVMHLALSPFSFCFCLCFPWDIQINVSTHLLISDLSESLFAATDLYK